MLSDEELATIAINAGEGSGYLSLAGIPPRTMHKYLRISRALRAALVPDVAPLGPGEVVTIPDAGDPDQCVVARLSAGGLLVTGFACLDAAGVRALRTACQRFLAA